MAPKTGIQNLSTRDQLVGIDQRPEGFRSESMLKGTPGEDKKIKKKIKKSMNRDHNLGGLSRGQTCLLSRQQCSEEGDE